MILSNGVCMIAFVYDGVCLTGKTSTTIEINFYMKLISIRNSFLYQIHFYSKLCLCLKCGLHCNRHWYRSRCIFMLKKLAEPPSVGGRLLPRKAAGKGGSLAGLALYVNLRMVGLDNPLHQRKT